MYFQMLVTLSMPTDALSRDVRRTVLHRLAKDDSFCGHGGRFGSPLCDWFVIGGRWSGFLGETLFGERFKQALADEYPDYPVRSNPLAIPAGHYWRLDDLWAICGGTGPSPYRRLMFDEYGYEDDAMLLTHELYDPLLSAFEGNETVRDGSHCEYADLDCEPLSPDFIGRKWLVVVDYHR